MERRRESRGFRHGVMTYRGGLSVYRGQQQAFMLAAATKEPLRTYRVEIPQEFLNERLNYFIGMVNHYDDIKKGLAEPIRCEHCDYCKATKI